jgi:hypothetical protein
MRTFAAVIFVTTTACQGHLLNDSLAPALDFSPQFD